MVDVYRKSKNIVNVTISKHASLSSLFEIFCYDQGTLLDTHNWTCFVLSAVVASLHVWVEPGLKPSWPGGTSHNAVRSIGENRDENTRCAF